MLDRFTDRARKVMSLAKEEAKSLKTTKVGTEHLLLALAKEQEGIAAEALDGLDAIAVGPPLKAVHTPDESMELASSERFYTLLVDVLKRLAA